MSFHSGLVCILGRSNAGKSTLLNALVGEKLAIISPKPQTTRNRILGILEIPKRKGAGGQVVLIDTPGVHRPDSSLGRKMMAEVREALEGCNLIFLIVDATRKFEQGDQFMLEMLKRSGTPAFLLMNKIDLLRGQKGKLLPIIDEYRRLHDFRETIPISARKRDGLDVLLEKTLAELPQGPRYFPEDQVTDQPARFMTAEIIREQILLATSEEVPYATTVVIEQFEEGAKLTRIAAFSFDAHKLALKLKITLAAHPNLVDAVVESVMDQIRKAHCATDKADAVELALTEALANAVVHGAKADPSKIIECDLMCDEAQRVLIVVRDPGQGFDVSSIPNPMNGDHLYSDHGRGIYLINQLMDEVKFMKNGTEIHMLKR